MNVSGWIRGMMSQSLAPEIFFKHVMGVVERELTEWGHDVILLYDWEAAHDCVAITMIIDGKLLSFKLEKWELVRRQHKRPFLVDELIWLELMDRGIEIKEDQYMSVVFPRKMKE